MLLLALLVAGCSEEQRGAPRLKTYPVTGTVLVDGVPAASLTVECHPEPGAQLKHEVATFTDENGKFSIGTYESKDGLPEGTYALAFIWPEMGIVAKDKLKGAYADYKKSEHKVTVVTGQPNDLGEINLKTK
jgi:hypothetical protein